MKIGLVYTSTTPELIDLVEKEVLLNLGSKAELLSYQDPSILADVRAAGYVTAAPAARLIALYMQAVQDGADAILNICSSVGEVADLMQPAAKYLGVPIVRIDEEMCRSAILCGKRIGVLATLPTTMEPTKRTLQRLAREMNREITLVDGLIDGAFGADQEQFRLLLLEQSMRILPEVDVILLCQGSMAYCKQFLEDSCDIPVLSSPVFGAAALCNALSDKGLI